MKTMKRLLAGALCLGMLMTGSLLAQAPPAPSVPTGKGTLTTLSGKIYLGASVSRIQPDGLVIAHDGGVAKVPFTDLAPVLRERFGYDPAAAARFAEEQAATVAAVDAEKARMAEAAREQAAAAAVEAAKPKLLLVSGEQVKQHWLKKLVAPRSLDRDYHDRQKEYLLIRDAIESGQMNVEAERQALKWNWAEYKGAGDKAMAKQIQEQMQALEFRAHEAEAARIRTDTQSEYRKIANQLALLSADLSALRTAAR